MIQLLRIAGSFVIVLVVYWTYALTAVPLIEPPPVTKGPAVISEGPLPEGSNQTDREMSKWAVLFPPGALRIENPKILQSDRVKLLIGEYETAPSGDVRIQPCIILLLPKPDGTPPDEAIKRATVLEAPQGAVLRFDKPFDLARARIGRLVSGRFDGPITIRSAGKTDDPDDDLLVVTQDVQLTERRVWTRQPVRFRYGPHFGSGREMDIRLLPGDETTARRGPQGPNVSGLESFELARLDRLHLLLPGESASLESAGLTPAGTLPATEATSAAGGDGPPREDIHVEVTCDGPFRFDAVKQEASFDERVVVTGMRGTADQYDRLENCDRLSVYFQRRADRVSPAGDGQSAKRPGLGDLAPCRLVAAGSPLVFRIPSESVAGRAERLDYAERLDDGVIRKDLTLEGNQPVFLQQKSSQIEARRLRYWSPEKPWLTGRMAAAGPGWIRAQLDDRPDKTFEARWNGQLQLRPYEQNQVISFTGGAELSYSGMGRLAASEIHFYLFEFPPPAGSQSPRLEPDRMKADGNVQLGSPRISGQVAELEVWFERGADAAAGQSAASPTGEAAGATGGRSASGGGAAPAAPQSPDNHFHVTARLLRARVVLHGQGEEPDVAELTLSDHVNLVQTRTADAGDKPVVVRGESIHVQDASKPHAALTIKGSPASFEGRGLTMVGSNINLNQGTNRLWIDGPGLMDLPANPTDLQGRPTGSEEPMRVEWRDRMEFDGRKVTVTGKVRAASRLQQLLTETLEASLNRMVRFAEAETLKDRSEFKMEELYCQGKAWMESRSVSETDPNVQESYEQAEVQNLRLNHATGALTAAGPGYVHSVSRSTGRFDEWNVGLPGSSPVAARQAAASGTVAGAAADVSLNYLHVRFQGGITGNIHKDKAEMTFHDQVHTVFGKVPTWNSSIAEDKPETWGPKGGVLGTDQLTVRQMPSPTGQGKTAEMEAIGNTRIEGQQYAAFCTRMAYDQDKGMMLLQGDGQTRATLMRQKQAGGPRDEASAQCIRYWPKTGTMESDGVGGIEINQIGASRPPKP